MATPRKAEGAELHALTSLLAVIAAFQKIRPTMPMQYVAAFALVALEEGLAVSEYAKRAGVSMSVMSRHLLDIGERNRHMEEGFGLVFSKPSPLELRRNEIYLTPKGRALANKVTAILK